MMSMEEHLAGFKTWDRCWKAYLQIQDRPELSTPFLHRLFELCFDDGVIDYPHANLFLLNVMGNIIFSEELAYFRFIFSKSVSWSYEKMNKTEKHLFLIEKTKQYLLHHIDSFYSMRFLYRKVVLLHFPELKDFSVRRLYDLCFDEVGLKAEPASDFISTFGKNNPFSRKLLRKFFLFSLLKFILFGGLCVGSIMLMISSKPMWFFIFLPPLALGCGLTGIQYFFKTLSAFFNFFKTKDFNFNTSILAYHKGRGGLGTFESVDSHIKQ